jgi:hypothetical protein
MRLPKKFNSTQSCNYRMAWITIACEDCQQGNSNKSTKSPILQAMVNPVTARATVIMVLLWTAVSSGNSPIRRINMPFSCQIEMTTKDIFTQTILTISRAIETADAQILFPFARPSFFTRRYYQLYPATEFNSTFWQRATWFGDFIVNCQSSPFVFFNS